MNYGYFFLSENYCKSAFPPAVHAESSPGLNKKRRKEKKRREKKRKGNLLQVPPTLYPDSSDPIVHILFALKFEGVNLQILAEVLPRISSEAIERTLEESANSIPVRKLGFLWEYFNGRSLQYKGTKNK